MKKQYMIPSVTVVNLGLTQTVMQQPTSFGMIDDERTDAWSREEMFPSHEDSEW